VSVPPPPAPVAAFLAAYAAQDEAAVRACCAEDLHYEDPLTAPLEGVDAFLVHLRAAWRAFPDGRLEATGPSPRTNALLAAPLKLVGTHRGPLGPVPPTDRFLVVHAVLYAELDTSGERLWRARTFYDVHGAATQIGALPKAGTAGQRALWVLQGFGLKRQ